MAETPFGTMKSDEDLSKAPTGPEIAENPGKFSGTKYDPVDKNVFRQAMQNYSNDDSADGLPLKMTFAFAFKFNREVALRVFASEHGGKELNLDALSAEQKTALGL